MNSHIYVPISCDVCRRDMDIPHRYVNVNRLLEQSLLLLTMPVQVDEVAQNFWRWILHGHVEWGVRPALPGQC